MLNDFEYYYNNVPGQGLCRNNLIYTSLINKNKTKFVQWYHNDTEYHKGQNEVVNPRLMIEKWRRETDLLNYIHKKGFGNYLPNFTIDETEKKIYLDIQGPDFWELSGCLLENYNSTLADWQQQMFEIFQMHRSIGLYKFSLHPSSYFIVDGKLKSINYFFAYRENESYVTVRDHLSHISQMRRQQLFPQMQSMGIDLDNRYDWKTYQLLCFESFSNNYPKDFIEEAKKIYV